MSDAASLTLSRQLTQWRNLQECLLHEIRWTNGLNTADVVFNYVWGPEGQVRQDVLEKPKLLTLHLVGVDSLLFAGALSRGMKGEPQRINWGLSEVAGVRVGEQDDLILVRVEWEGERRLEVACVDANLVEHETN